MCEHFVHTAVLAGRKKRRKEGAADCPENIQSVYGAERELNPSS